MAWLALLPIASAPAFAGPNPEVLAGSGKWEINYDTDSCHLMTQAGTGDDAIVVRFTRYDRGDSFQLDLFGKRFKHFNSNPGVGTQFLPGGEYNETASMVADAGELGVLLLGGTDLTGHKSGKADAPRPPVAPADELGITQLRLRINRGRDIFLNLGSLGKPFASLRACTDNLLRQWGYDPAAQAALASRPTPANNPASWATSSDYPNQALAKGLSGIVTFRLDVDATGAVRNCSIVASTQPAEFKAATCKALTQRARFKPARDLAGAAVPSYYINRVRWLSF